ncbi:hypothetical protein FACS189418_5490 [Clostridia bacterium]|nr:hypothetical protein FACS189418_5490 [Clostridia bacterium]
MDSKELRDLAKRLIDQMPENKLMYVIPYLQGAALNAADDNISAQSSATTTKTEHAKSQSANDKKDTQTDSTDSKNTESQEPPKDQPKLQFKTTWKSAGPYDPWADYDPERDKDDEYWQRKLRGNGK